MSAFDIFVAWSMVVIVSIGITIAVSQIIYTAIKASRMRKVGEAIRQQAIRDETIVAIRNRNNRRTETQ